MPEGDGCHQGTTSFCQEPFLESLRCARDRAVSQEEVSCWWKGVRKDKGGGGGVQGGALLPSTAPWAEGLAMPVQEPS